MHKALILISTICLASCGSVKTQSMILTQPVSFAAAIPAITLFDTQDAQSCINKSQFTLTATGSNAEVILAASNSVLNTATESAEPTWDSLLEGKKAKRSFGDYYASALTWVADLIYSF